MSTTSISSSTSVWQKCWSKSKDRPYWFNKTTGKSVWEDPTVVKDAPSSSYSEVAQHYNTKVQRQESSFIRNFNNWIKTVLITETVDSIMKPRCLKDPEYPQGDRITPDLLYAQQDFFQWYKQQGANRVLNVLDLACGQGGDLGKWNYHPVRYLEGMDVAPEAILRARERIDKMNPKYKSYMGVFDVSHPLKLKTTFDIVSMQFAVHYLFKSEKTLNQLLGNISRALRPGGYFVGTMIGYDGLKDKILTQESLNTAEMTIDLSDEAQKVLRDESPEQCGLEYRFSLLNAVRDLPEYLVPTGLFVSTAARHGLKYQEIENFQKYYYNHANQYMPLYQKNVGYNHTTSEWHTACTYSVFTFVKQ
jgi:SAM-dependent methyltransferase